MNKGRIGAEHSREAVLLVDAISTRVDAYGETKIYRDTMYLVGRKVDGMMKWIESKWGKSVEEETV
jgi:hypothetical protein